MYPKVTNFMVLAKDKNYTFVYAIGTKGVKVQHDYAGQYKLNIYANDTITLAENAKKMYATAAAVVSMTAISYLI